MSDSNPYFNKPTNPGPVGPDTAPDGVPVITLDMYLNRHGEITGIRSLVFDPNGGNGDGDSGFEALLAVDEETLVLEVTMLFPPRNI